MKNIFLENYDYKVIEIQRKANRKSNILDKKITKEHLSNYLKHSYKIYKS